MKVFRFFVKIEQHLKMLFLVPFLCCDADGGMWPFWNYEQSGVSQSGVGTLRLFFLRMGIFRLSSSHSLTVIKMRTNKLSGSLTISTFLTAPTENILEIVNFARR